MLASETLLVVEVRLVGLVESLLAAAPAGHGTATRGGPVAGAAGQTGHAPPPAVPRPQLASPSSTRPLSRPGRPEPGIGDLGGVQGTDPGIAGGVTAGQDGAGLHYHALPLGRATARNPPADRQLLLDTENKD